MMSQIMEVDMPPYVHSFVATLADPVAQTCVVGVLLLIALDIAAGLGGAIISRTFSSVKMRAGIVHKYMELVAIVLSIVMDGMLTSGLDLSYKPVMLATCAYLALMEVGSVLEIIKTYNPDTGGLVSVVTSHVRCKDGRCHGGDSDG